MPTVLNVIELLMSFGGTIALCLTGLYVIRPKKDKRKRPSKIERARQKRQAIYAEAEAAQKVLMATKHKAREEVAAIWVRQWMDTGISVHELNSSFQKWEGDPYYATSQVVDKKDSHGHGLIKNVEWRAIGTIDAPTALEGEGHRWAVGSEPNYFSHGPVACPKCARIEKERAEINKRKVAEKQGFVRTSDGDYVHSYQIQGDNIDLPLASYIS